VSTAHDLPYGYAEPAPAAVPALRLVPTEPLDFDDAVRRVRPRLHRYAIRRLGDVHEAEELVQEALLRAYSHREQLLTEEDLSAWTTVVTGRLVIDRLRVRGRSTSFADVPETGRVGRDTADIVVGRDEARTALDALDAMPARQASLLWAREVEGQSYEELCARFGMTEPAVRSVLTRARKALRKEYETRGGTLPVGGLAVLAPWIAGMTWADKLRSAVSRITAPAALATVGITALGGLVISPFGGAFDQGPHTFSPGSAVVSVSAVPADNAPLHGFVTRAISTPTVQRPAAAQASSNLHQPSARTILHGIDDVNCTSTEEASGSSPQALVSQVSHSLPVWAEGTACAPAPKQETVIASPIDYDLEVGGYTVPTAVVVQQGDVACRSEAPNTSVAYCHSTPTQQGAAK
jgi:RNA polymerase sigma-70 factor (ECF subfamily)